MSARVARRYSPVAGRPARCAGLCVAALLFSCPAFAETQDGGAPVAAPAGSGAIPAGPGLSPLPKPPRIEPPTPSAGSLRALDEILAALVSKDETERETGTRRILEVDGTMLPAIHRRIITIADRSDHDAMKRVLSDVRSKERKRERARKKAEADDDEDGPDYVTMLAADARPDDESYRYLAQVVGMGRMLQRLGTVEAARELILIYVRFGEFLRVFVQRELAATGDRSLAALIEAQRHPAEKIGRWASRQLDLRGKAIPSEVVQTEDFQVLADVLRAYGRNKDPDAARIIVSFSNSERSQIREAAREAVALLGEVADWQLRDTYENIVGKRASREWSWERTARELFTEFDRLRLSQVYVLFEQGLAAQQKGDLAAMATAFDKVLARSPLFDLRERMAAGYVAYARTLLDSEPEKASAALERARRIGAPEGQKPIESLILTLEAERLFAKGLSDQVLLRRAVDLDPANERARSLLDRIQRGDVQTPTTWNRYVAAGAIGMAALGAIAFLLLRRPRRVEAA